MTTRDGTTQPEVVVEMNFVFEHCCSNDDDYTCNRIGEMSFCAGKIEMSLRKVLPDSPHCATSLLTNKPSSPLRALDTHTSHQLHTHHQHHHTTCSVRFSRVVSRSSIRNAPSSSTIARRFFASDASTIVGIDLGTTTAALPSWKARRRV